MDIVNLGRRKAMELKSGIVLAECSKKVLIPFDSEIGMKTTLHQYAGSAKRDRFVDSFPNLIYRVDVSIFMPRPAIERAERADHVTDVCIVDVPVDDIGDDTLRMEALSHLVRSHSDAGNVV
jgi:hypothetical protein